LDDLIYDIFMADIIELVPTEKPALPKEYSVDITQYTDNLRFTLNGIKVNPDSLRKIADELEKIARIIRNDVVTGIV